MTAAWLAFWLVPALFVAIGLSGIEAWKRNHDPNYKPMTLLNLFQGMALAGIPVINIMAAIFVVDYFFGRIPPNIILFGKKQ